MLVQTQLRCDDQVSLRECLFECGLQCICVRGSVLALMQGTREKHRGFLGVGGCPRTHVEFISVVNRDRSGYFARLVCYCRFLPDFTVEMLVHGLLAFFFVINVFCYVSCQEII